MSQNRFLVVGGKAPPAQPVAEPAANNLAAMALDQLLYTYHRQVVDALHAATVQMVSSRYVDPAAPLGHAMARHGLQTAVGNRTLRTKQEIRRRISEIEPGDFAAGSQARHWALSLGAELRNVIAKEQTAANLAIHMAGALYAYAKLQAVTTSRLPF